MREMTLREVCNRIGITRRTVQGYEQAGMVSPSGKNKYGYLLYGQKEIEKIEMIKQYQDFGFSIKEIKELLNSSEEIYLEMMRDRLEKMKEEQFKLEKNISIIQKMLKGS